MQAIKNKFRQRWCFLISKYLGNEEKQIKLPQLIIWALKIQQSFICLSYICAMRTNSYLDWFSIYARPQIYLPDQNFAQYALLILLFLYIINILIELPFSSLIRIFGQIIKSGLLNFLFEYSTGSFQYTLRPLFIIFSLIEILLLQESLNIQYVNLQDIIYTHIDYIIIILNYLIMIIYSYYQQQMIIDIIGFTMNCLQLINLIFYKSMQDLSLKSMLIAIYIQTLIIELLYKVDMLENCTTQIVFFPILYQTIQKILQNRIKLLINKYQKEILNKVQFQSEIFFNLKSVNLNQIKLPNENKEKLIYISVQICYGLFYKSYTILKQMKISNFSIFLNIKREHLLTNTKQQILNLIDLNSGLNPQMMQTIKLLKQNEDDIYEIQSKLNSLIRQKILNQLLLMEPQTKISYENYLQFSSQLTKLKNQLELQYHNFPSEKNQNILLFFYVEILNDIITAIEVQKVSVISDEKLNKIVQNQYIFSSKNVIYLITHFNEIKKQLVIQRGSHGTELLFKCQKNKIQEINLQFYIIPFLAEIHDELIESFLQTGKCQFIRKINETVIYYEKQNSTLSISMIFDVSFTKCLDFIVFIQPHLEEKMIMILDKNHCIKYMSQELITKVNLQDQLKYYLEINISAILASFCEQNLLSIFSSNNGIANFNYYSEVENKLQIIDISTYYTYFSCHMGMLNKEHYYTIIQFDYFKKIINYQKKSIQDEKENYYIDEDCRIKTPYSENTAQFIFDPTQQNQQQIEKITNQENVIQGTPEQTLQNSFQKETVGVNQLDSNRIDSKGENTRLLLSNYDHENDQILINQIKSPQYQEKDRLNSKLYLESNHHIMSNLQQDNQQVFHDDGASQMSSLHGLRKSKYFKKYQIIQKINNLKGFQPNHKLCLFSLLNCIIVTFTLSILQLAIVNTSLVNLASDIDIISIKNKVYQPLESFLVTRWTIANYNLLKSTITLSQYQNLVKFPRSNLALGYDQLSENVKSIFDKIQLQDFLENTFLNISMYQNSVFNSNVGFYYNISLRNSMSILLNYEYQIKMAYIIDGAVVTDSPYIYYTYSNYIKMKNEFDQLSKDMLTETINRQNQIFQKIQLISILNFIFFIVLILIMIYFYIKNQKQINKFYTLTHNIQSEFIETDISRLKQITEQIVQDNDVLSKYNFNLESKEKLFVSFQNQVTSLRRNNKKQSYLKIEDKYQYLYILFLIFIVLLNLSLTFNLCNQYLSKYEETSKFYKALADLGTDVPTIYAQRGVLQGRDNFPYFNSTDFQDLMLQVTDALQRTKQFYENVINFDNIISSPQFSQKYNTLQSSNLCNFLPDFLVVSANTICPIIMNQNMQRGLKPVLIYITNSIQTDKDFNNFTVRTQPSYLELEGAFIISNIIQMINEEFTLDLEDQTNSFIINVNLINIILLILLFFLAIFGIYKIKLSLIFKQQLIYRFIHILPLRTLILDDNFERNFREIMLQK